MLLGLGAVGAQVAVEVAPTAAAAAVASVVLVIVELRVISGRWLGGAIQEVGERAGCETCLRG